MKPSIFSLKQPVGWQSAIWKKTLLPTFNLIMQVTVNILYLQNQKATKTVLLQNTLIPGRQLNGCQRNVTTPGGSCVSTLRVVQLVTREIGVFNVG